MIVGVLGLPWGPDVLLNVMNFVHRHTHTSITITCTPRSEEGGREIGRERGGRER